MPKKEGKARKILMNFSRVMLILILLGAFFNDRKLILYVAILALFITFLPAILEKFFKVKIPATTEIMIILLIYGSFFLAEVRLVGAQFWWWDIVLNFGAALALGLVGLTVLYALHKDKVINASPLIIAFFAFCFAVAIGAVWEIFEFGMDTFFGFTMQKTGLTDTMGDMIVNSIGAFVIATVGYFYIKDGKIIILSSLVMKAIEKNPKLFKARQTLESSSELIEQLIKKGESNKLEFKSTLRTNLHTNEIDSKIEHSALKTIVAYLNSDGGTLLVGVSDEGEVTGIEKDNFPDNDKLGLYFTNLIKHKIGNSFLPFINFEIFPVRDRHILKVDCNKSKNRCFLILGQEEEFYARNGPSSTKLTGNALIDYVNHRFKDS
jgi:hypothetical protein